MGQPTDPMAIATFTLENYHLICCDFFAEQYSWILLPDDVIGGVGTIAFIPWPWWIYLAETGTVKEIARISDCLFHDDGWKHERSSESTELMGNGWVR